MKSTVAPYETAAWCVRIECTNSMTLRMTTYPFDLTMSNSEIYKTDSGYEATAYTSNTKFAASAIDLSGIAGIAGISRDQIVSGVFDNARVHVFKCDFLNPVEDYDPVTCGFFGKTTLEDDRYTVEGMALIDALNQSVGRSYAALCTHTFGDARCGIDIGALTVAGTVSVVTSNSVIRDTSRTESADYFAGGKIAFTSGNNDGLKAQEIKSYAADGTITTFEPFYYPPEIGDTFVLIPGCRKRLTDCRDKWDNVINRFAFDYMPTSSVYAAVGGTK